MRNVKSLALQLLFLVLLGSLSACATTSYKTHYGIFAAETSQGEIRDFRVYWQTIRTEGWTEERLRVTPITLETQCSERKLYFYDRSHGRARKCIDAAKSGIVSCGSKGQDVDPRGVLIEETAYCGYITDDDNASRIANLDERIKITFQCRPNKVERRKGSGLVSVDYIRASAVPYTITTKTVQGQSIEKLIPPLNNHPSVCENL